MLYLARTFGRLLFPCVVGGLLLQIGVANSQQMQQERFRHSGRMRPERPSKPPASQERFTEAPAAFDNRTNGMDPQGPVFETLNEDNVVALRSFNDNRFIYEESEDASDGLGPTYNAQSCRECHQNVVTGGASQIAEHRSGRIDKNNVFFESMGGSLIQSRAIEADIVELQDDEDNVSTFRLSTSTLGAGFVECISNEELLAIRDAQPAEIRGTALMVPVMEGDGSARLGRFGWKNQHASLESFSADAYLNEMGITNPLLADENLSHGKFVGAGTRYDKVADPEDDGTDLLAFANFMRSTKAPPRGAITPEVTAGERVFTQIGCAACHTATIRTSRPGTQINGGAFIVPAALGNKIIHPYSDYLMHDIGTGDGIPVLPTAEYASTASQMRTAPLWGMRTRNRLMHDGLAFTKQEAIRRHAGQAAASTARYKALSAQDQRTLMKFLDSL